MQRILVCLFAIFQSAWAAEIHVEVDNRRLQEGESVGLYLSVVDGHAQGTPRMPIVDGLSIENRGRRQSLVQINGQPARTTTFVYSLTGLRAGIYDLPAFAVNVSGKAYNTQPLTIEVTPRDEGQSGGVQSGFGLSKMWVGQTVVHHVSLRVPGRILQSRWTPPEMEGFAPEQSAQATQREYNTQLDAQTWGVLEIFTPLLATSAGAREIPPGVLQVDLPSKRKRMRLFNDSRSEVFPTQPISVAVYPLPEEGRSADFAGLVGDFELSVELSKTALSVGESSTLTVRLNGDGSLAGFRLPPMTDLEGFAVYDDEPANQGQIVDGAFQSAGTYKRAIVPEEKGRFVLPPIRVQTFSPAVQDYVLLEGPSIELVVSAGDGVAVAEPFASPDVQVSTPAVQDILPLRPSASLRSQQFAVTPVFLWVALGPIGVFLLLLSRHAYQRRAPVRDVKKELRNRVRSLRSPTDEELEVLLRDCLAWALKRSSSGIRRADFQELSDLALREEALSLYRSLEAARYGGGSRVSPEGARACLRKILELR